MSALLEFTERGESWGRVPRSPPPCPWKQPRERCHPSGDMIPWSFMFLSRLILTALSLWSPCQWVPVRDVVGTRAEVSSLLRVQTTGEGIKIYIQVSVGISGAPWAQLVTPTVSRGQCELSHQSQQTCDYSYPSSHGSSMSSWLSSPQKFMWKAHLVPIPPLNSTTVCYRVLGASHVKRIFFFWSGVGVCSRQNLNNWLPLS